MHDRLLWILLVLVALGVAAYAAVSRIARADTLSILSEVADFTLIERSGKPITLADLHGKVWIAGQTFNCCTMSCPQVRAALQQLQGELRHTNVTLVSISVDPAGDTPEALRAMADALGADPKRWLFLTGNQDVDQVSVHAFVESSFLSRPVVDASAEPGRRVAHSSRLFLVDRKGRLRGSYACVEEALGKDQRLSGLFVIDERELARLARDADALDAGPLGGVIRVSRLPTLNAILNATSAILLVAGYVLIRRRRIRPHMACMLSAVGVSTIFLASYVYYHYFQGHTTFPDVWVRPIYLGILLTHVVLAIAVVPLVLWTLYRAFTLRFDAHRRIARWTLPIWLYVSVTGVVVYVFLYHLYPQ